MCSEKLCKCHYLRSFQFGNLGVEYPDLACYNSFQIRPWMVLALLDVRSNNGFLSVNSVGFFVGFVFFNLLAWLLYINMLIVKYYYFLYLWLGTHQSRCPIENWRIQKSQSKLNNTKTPSIETMDSFSQRAPT